MLWLRLVHAKYTTRAVPRDKVILKQFVVSDVFGKGSVLDALLVRHRW